MFDLKKHLIFNNLISNFKCVNTKEKIGIKFQKFRYKGQNIC